MLYFPLPLPGVRGLALLHEGEWTPKCGLVTVPRILQKKKKAVLENMGQITDYAKDLHIHSFFLPEKQQHPWTRGGDIFRNPLTFPDL